MDALSKEAIAKIPVKTTVGSTVVFLVAAWQVFAYVENLKQTYALQCYVDQKFFETQAVFQQGWANDAQDTAQGYLNRAPVDGMLEKDRLRYEEKLRQQSRFQGQADAFSSSAAVVCSANG